jgi:hypothetical protein
MHLPKAGSTATAHHTTALFIAKKYTKHKKRNTPKNVRPYRRRRTDYFSQQVSRQGGKKRNKAQESAHARSGPPATCACTRRTSASASTHPRTLMLCAPPAQPKSKMEMANKY